MKAILRALLVCPLLGCVHSSHNLTGNIEVEKRPTNIQSEKTERPADPGESLLLWNAGLLGGGGLRLSSDHPGLGSVSVETSLHRGWSESSHTSDLLPPLPVPFATTALGVNLGWTWGSKERPASSAGYAELQFSKYGIFALAGGWGWDPGRELSGPQFTGYLGPLFLRSSTMLNSGTSLEVGLSIKLPVIHFTERR